MSVGFFDLNAAPDGWFDKNASPLGWFDRALADQAVGPPFITVQPTDQSSTVGGTATFTATVTGIGLTYQWQRLAPS